MKIMLKDTNKYSIHTELIKLEAGIVVVKAILDTERGTYTGHAMEEIGSSQINKTSALENCETSAVGRALGFAGYGSVESIASGDEVAHAIKQQESLEPEYATPNQVKYIQNLCQEKAMDCEYDFEKMTKQEAGSVIEKMLSK